MKDVLRKRNLSTSGMKAELIQRLTKADPNVWAKMYEQASSIPAAIDEEELDEMTEESELISLTNVMDEAPTFEASASASVATATTVPRRAPEDDMIRELTLLRREKDLWERER